jgi:hypothetical protein
MPIEFAKNQSSAFTFFAWPAGSLRSGLLGVQGLYYLLTGMWPLVSIRSFQVVTGPKTDHLPTGLEADHWLVLTVGVLVTAIAVGLLTAAWRRSRALETPVIAIGSAIGLTSIDVIYVARRVIDPIYLLDAAIEVVLIAAWVVVLAIDRSRRDGPRS